MYYQKKPRCRNGYSIKRQPNFFNLYSQRTKWLCQSSFVRNDAGHIIGINKHQPYVREKSLVL